MVNIKDIFDISAEDSAFTVRYYFSLRWKDWRLRFTPFTRHNKTVEAIYLPVDMTEDQSKNSLTY